MRRVWAFCWGGIIGILGGLLDLGGAEQATGMSAGTCLYEDG